mmetsp:Transcript_15815/g.61798  ORF Transcript_15815/g.61798 Transcript_15815/m.61798 type:complete len:602 (+) Transcript_15815:283-2088(+)
MRARFLLDCLRGGSRRGLRGSSRLHEARSVLLGALLGHQTRRRAPAVRVELGSRHFAESTARALLGLRLLLLRRPGGLVDAGQRGEEVGAILEASVSGLRDARLQGTLLRLESERLRLRELPRLKTAAPPPCLLLRRHFGTAARLCCEPVEGRVGLPGCLCLLIGVLCRLGQLPLLRGRPERCTLVSREGERLWLGQAQWLGLLGCTLPAPAPLGRGTALDAVGHGALAVAGVARAGRNVAAARRSDRLAKSSALLRLERERLRLCEGEAADLVRLVLLAAEPGSKVELAVGATVESGDLGRLLLVDLAACPLPEDGSVSRSQRRRLRTRELALREPGDAKVASALQHLPVERVGLEVPAFLQLPLVAADDRRLVHRAELHALVRAEIELARLRELASPLAVRGRNRLLHGVADLARPHRPAQLDTLLGAEVELLRLRDLASPGAVQRRLAVGGRGVTLPPRRAPALSTALGAERELLWLSRLRRLRLARLLAMLLECLLERRSAQASVCSAAGAHHLDLHDGCLCLLLLQSPPPLLDLFHHDGLLVIDRGQGAVVAVLHEEVVFVLSLLYDCREVQPRVCGCASVLHAGVLHDYVLACGR